MEELSKRGKYVIFNSDKSIEFMCTQGDQDFINDIEGRRLIQIVVSCFQIRNFVISNNKINELINTIEL